jgi:hypothetical protein
MGVSQGLLRSGRQQFLIRLKKAFRAAYRLRLVACFFPFEIRVKKERISSEEIEVS